MKDTVEALNPQPGKKPTKVNRRNYEAYRRALLRVIPEKAEGVEYSKLVDLVVAKLPHAVAEATKPKWWVTTVKLDLEARGLIERVPGVTPQRLRKL
ncbi:MAG: hypothetical protein D6695_07625 [Planctomycetota bacterium]|nr:MAG: hypothetical protein D6695_07625 [Planctomycetota bacterium]